MAKAAILISPGAIDGYPPVQNQARLLANAGFAVEVITSPRIAGAAIDFHHPGVSLTTIGIVGPGVRSAARTAAYVRAISASRLRRKNDEMVEIAYDPIGVFYSDLALFRPRFRIAHLHEGLPHLDRQWLERRLAKALDQFSTVVVPGEERADLLLEQLPFVNRPLVVCNYPFRDDYELPPRQSGKTHFEVIYAGSIGRNQSIDFIVDSIRLWPEQAVLTLVGDTDRPIARQIVERMRVKGLGDRVKLTGWVDQDSVHGLLCSADLGICLLATQTNQLRTALGASNKRYQYMKAGLPQIGDVNPGVPEFIHGHQIGRCLTDWSHEALAKIIADYACNMGQCQREGDRARALHLEQYNYQTTFAPLLDRIERQVSARDTT